MSANNKQIGGKHYKGAIQHWDFCYEHNYDIFQTYISKYLHRWKDKNGLEDLYKARHCLDKYIEVVETGGVKISVEEIIIHEEEGEADGNYVNQD